MSKMLSRWLKKPCPHEETLIVRSVNVQRTVCEACGHVSFTMSQSNVPEAHEPRVAKPLARTAAL